MSATPVTFVNVFDVEPADHAQLVELLAEALDQVIRHRPGFVAARLLVAADDRTVINETIWSDREAIAATQQDPAVAKCATLAAALGIARPGVYRVHSEFGS